MEKLSLNIEFPKNGTPYLRIYRAIYRNKETNMIEEGIYYSTKDAILKEITIHTKILNYSYLYTETELVFIK